MRPIKFRGKYKDKKIKNWAYGESANDEVAAFTDDIAHFRYLLNDFFRLLEQGFLDPETVGQFTGLTDKNGKEDWIDDIVKAKMGGITYYRKIFQAESGAFCIRLPTLGSTCVDGEAIMLITCEHENVGDVHEHPERLKGGG